MRTHDMWMASRDLSQYVHAMHLLNALFLAPLALGITE